MKDHTIIGKEKVFQTMSGMSSAQIVTAVATKGLALTNPPCLPYHSGVREKF